MKAISYVTNAVGNGLSRKKITDEIKRIRESLVDNTLGTYSNAAEFFADYKFQSKETEQFQKLFNDSVRTEWRGNYNIVVNQALIRAAQHLSVLENQTNRNFNQDVLRDSLTYLKSAILQYIEAVDFLNKYANRLLIWTYTAEAAAAEVNRRVPLLVPAEIEWLNKNRDDFFRIVQAFDRTVKEVEELLSKTPDVLINETSQTMVQQTHGPSATDPFRMGFVNGSLNPFLYFGKLWAEMNVDRYNADKDYKTTSELKLLHLKQLRNGERDAALEQRIAFLESEIQKTHRKIEQWESKNA